MKHTLKEYARLAHEADNLNALKSCLGSVIDRAMLGSLELLPLGYRQPVADVIREQAELYEAELHEEADRLGVEIVFADFGEYRDGRLFHHSYEEWCKDNSDALAKTGKYPLDDKESRRRDLKERVIEHD